MKSNIVISICRSLAVVLSVGNSIPVWAQVVPSQGEMRDETRVQVNGNQIEVTGGARSQDGNNLFHTFERFGLTAEQTATFYTHPAIRNVFARVVGGDPSLIDGLLELRGGSSNLFLMNPAGILLGRNARLNLPGMFSATTATGLEFEGGVWETMARKGDRFSGDPKQFLFALTQPSAIVNLGNLSVLPGQSLTLMGGSVVNAGTIAAAGGQITIAAIPGSQRVRLTQAGNVLGLEVQPLGEQGLLNLNSNSIAQLLTRSSDLNHATQMTVDSNGKVMLNGSGLTIPNRSGVAVVSGSVNTSSVNEFGNAGGVIQIAGDRVALVNATVQANGDAKGGMIAIGGQNRSTTLNSTLSYIDRDTKISANANQTGNGGVISIWSDRKTQFLGQVSATGGQLGGDGGQIEVSGKVNLGFDGAVTVSAAKGKFGTIVLDPDEILISASQESAGLPSSLILESGTKPGEPTVLHPSAIAAMTGDLVLAANRQIWIQGDQSPTLFLGSGGKITFRAGEAFFSEKMLQSQGRSIEIQAPAIKVPTIDTALAANRDGTVTLQGLNGQWANQVKVDNILTPNQDVTIRSQRVEGQFIATNATSQAGAGGQVTLESQGALMVGGILTEGKSVSLTSDERSRTGYVQSGVIWTSGGAVSLSGNRVNGGLIWTTPDKTGSAGNVQIRAQTELTARRIEANGKGNGRAGTVSLVNRTGDVSVDSIQADAQAGGGRVELEGDRIRVMGSSFYVPEQYSGSTLLQSSSVRAGESIVLRQRGGPLNQPFVVGNAMINGTSSGLAIGDTLLKSGSFAIREKPMEYFPLSAGSIDRRITIVAQNTAPTFPGLEGLRVLQFSVKPGDRAEFRLADLGVRSPIDIDGDRMSVYLRSPVVLKNGVLLDSSGRFVSPFRPIDIHETLTYRASVKTGSAFDAFQLVALDVPPTIEAFDRYGGLPLRFDIPRLPQEEPRLAPMDSSAVWVPSGSVLSNVSAQEAAAMDAQMSQEYYAKGLTNDRSAAIDGSGLAQQIEGRTGIRPALVYIRVTPGEMVDDIELTMLTARGRLRKHTTLAQGHLMEAAKTFRREVTNPLKTHTTSYLSSAQQLYHWLIEPLRAELQAQGVTNLVFLPDAGLRSIPYSALHDGQRFLMEQFSVGLMPSLSLTQTEYQDLREASVLAVGVSEATQGQTALPMVKTEVAMLSKLWDREVMYLNEQATLKTLQTARQRHSFAIVHLATHANFKAGAPKDAYIQLWEEQLKLQQLREFDWNHPPVELLVLSACRTALGDRDSELGFAGLAVQTGVKTAVASLWAVSDTATTALMSKFYHALKTSPVKADALRQAQIALSQGKVKVVDSQLVGVQEGLSIDLPEDAQISDPDFRHPYYWAAFTMVGNPW